ncbi:MAG TPA: HAMP domain-containing sensor histidine kinase [Myxococcota bacterium]|nr:HAMP domain-containing sensor histidine kinase [Myxococcota bacterium]HNH46257.1 HAMP domain-containing sensor histidine kinase [Myxococcota bacterium]
MSQESAESRRILAGELALGLVHEMNQPIQLLAGHLERLREGAPPEWARSLVSMERAVQRISLLVLQLRGYSHPRSGPPTRVRLADLVEGAQDLCGLRLGSGAGFCVDIEEGLEVEGDAVGLEQVVVNLLLNATQSGTPELGLRAFRREGEVWVEVWDRGPGVAAELREQIFDAFYTTKQRGEGSGLGLWISRRILLDHGGNLEVEDNPGGGALFRMRLPG